MSLGTALYRSALRIRRVEEAIARLYPSESIRTPVHLSIGQEAAAVGVAAALAGSDVVFPTYRGHAAYLAKGGSLRKMMAELFGRAGGCAGGKGGSMHLIDVDAGVMGGAAIVAAGIAPAVGYALAERMRRRDTVVACFFGDGAMEEGVFHESLNFAALRRLPVLFVCENNGYAIESPLSARVAAGSLYGRAAAFGLDTARVADGDVLAVHGHAVAAAQAMRQGGGPFFLEVCAPRWSEHVGPGMAMPAGGQELPGALPRPQADCVACLAPLVEPEVRQAIARAVEEEIAAAILAARQLAEPSPEALWTDVLHG